MKCLEILSCIVANFHYKPAQTDSETRDPLHYLGTCAKDITVLEIRHLESRLPPHVHVTVTL